MTPEENIVFLPQFKINEWRDYVSQNILNPKFPGSDEVNVFPSKPTTPYIEEASDSRAISRKSSRGNSRTPRRLSTEVNGVQEIDNNGDVEISPDGNILEQSESLEGKDELVADKKPLFYGISDIEKAEALETLGIAEYYDGNWVECYNALAKSINDYAFLRTRRDPVRIGTINLLIGIALFRMGEFDKAEEQFNLDLVEGLQSDPKVMLIALTNRALVLSKVDRLQDAILLSRRAIMQSLNINGVDSFEHLQHARVLVALYVKAKEYPKAMNTLDENPFPPEERSLLAAGISFSSGDLKTSIDILNNYFDSIEKQNVSKDLPAAVDLSSVHAQIQSQVNKALLLYNKSILNDSDKDALHEALSNLKRISLDLYHQKFEFSKQQTDPFLYCDWESFPDIISRELFVYPTLAWSAVSMADVEREMRGISFDNGLRVQKGWFTPGSANHFYKQEKIKRISGKAVRILTAASTGNEELLKIADTDEGAIKEEDIQAENERLKKEEEKRQQEENEKKKEAERLAAEAATELAVSSSEIPLNSTSKPGSGKITKSKPSTAKSSTATRPTTAELLLTDDTPAPSPVASAKSTSRPKSKDQELQSREPPDLSISKDFFASMLQFSDMDSTEIINSKVASEAAKILKNCGVNFNPSTGILGNNPEPLSRPKSRAQSKSELKRKQANAMESEYVPMRSDPSSFRAEMTVTRDVFGRTEAAAWIQWALASSGGISFGYLGQSASQAADIFGPIGDQKPSIGPTEAFLLEIKNRMVDLDAKLSAVEDASMLGESGKLEYRALTLIVLIKLTGQLGLKREIYPFISQLEKVAQQLLDMKQCEESRMYVALSARYRLEIEEWFGREGAPDAERLELLFTKLLPQAKKYYHATADIREAYIVRDAVKKLTNVYAAISKIPLNKDARTLTFKVNQTLKELKEIDVNVIEKFETSNQEWVQVHGRLRAKYFYHELKAREQED